LFTVVEEGQEVDANQREGEQYNEETPEWRNHRPRQGERLPSTKKKGLGPL
jgi:hypothetical protein